MASAEKRTDRIGRTYYRARYIRPDGKKATVKGSDGKAIEYPTKLTAKKAARAAQDAADAAAKRGRWVAPEEGLVTLSEYLHGPAGEGGWLSRHELAASTEQNYRNHLRHAEQRFGDTVLGDIRPEQITAWEKQKKSAGSPVSAATYRRMLHLVLEDAVEDGILQSNPAKQRRGRGKRAGRSSSRGPEKAVTDSLGILLLAERAALLSGRDDEFTAVILTGYTGMRWGEVVGLTPKYARAGEVRVEQQLYELEDGTWEQCPPKDDSYRTLDAPPWLTRLLAEQVARSRRQPCQCHGERWVFRGGAGAGSGAGPTMKEVAAVAGVSVQTVSNARRRPEKVRAETLARVEKATAELDAAGRGAGPEGSTDHWRRSGFATWVFTPAATGWYPPKAPQPRRPVPVDARLYPGLPVHGRGAEGRATASWLPVQERLTRHGLRHAHRTLMEQLGVRKVLVDQRMGHADSSVSAQYAHVTDDMREFLLRVLTEQWEESLAARRAMHPRSPVSTLDRLLGQ
ncbi:LacI family DNA-binding transcriptional regulator [Streptomyces lonarensis]|uniref:LacI family DNA-binding transcriptional regulator n=1 Tax=Streptomyces lonarensis TaxID=700599 RepID=UPI001FD77A6F|nr:LacI family DNA-binding transcriptional regulator [Streptomyces lonarensis]